MIILQPITDLDGDVASVPPDLPEHHVVRRAIDLLLHLEHGISAPEFVSRLADVGVHAVPSIAKFGAMNGFSFLCADVRFPSSHLGSDYKWSKLQERGLSYVQSRDLDALSPASKSLSTVRSTGPSVYAPKRVSDADVLRTKQTDPSVYLASNGFIVTRSRNHLSVRLEKKEVYRCTQKDDGVWLSCDLHGKKVGDNVSLIKHVEPGLNFVEAVSRLIGGTINTTGTATEKPAAVLPATPVRVPPSVPRQSDKDVELGRAYLAGRGISLQTMETAEQAGMLRYSYGAVLFVGRDENGTAQNIMRRSVNPTDFVQKRDLAGTDKRHPQVLMGSRETVLIVEGGTDALAAVDIGQRSNKPTPTILSTGGAGVRSWIDTPWVQVILQAASKIIVVHEIESSEEVQARTDAAHELQMEKIRSVCKAQVISWTPGAKDLAELNFLAAQEVKPA